MKLRFATMIALALALGATHAAHAAPPAPVGAITPGADRSHATPEPAPKLATSDAPALPARPRHTGPTVPAGPAGDPSEYLLAPEGAQVTREADDGATGAQVWTVIYDPAIPGERHRLIINHKFVEWHFYHQGRLEVIASSFMRINAGVRGTDARGRLLWTSSGQDVQDAYTWFTNPRGGNASARCGPPCFAIVVAAVKGFQACSKVPFVGKICKQVLKRQLKPIFAKVFGVEMAKAVLQCSASLPKSTPKVLRTAASFLCG